MAARRSLSTQSLSRPQPTKSESEGVTSLPSLLLLLDHHRHHRHHRRHHHHHKFSVKSSTIILLFIPRKEPAEASKRDAHLFWRFHYQVMNVAQFQKVALLSRPDFSILHALR